MELPKLRSFQLLHRSKLIPRKISVAVNFLIFHTVPLFLGSSRIMRDYIETMAGKYETIMLDRAENLLHDWFGDVEYWSIRRSMRFAPDLVKIANEFRLNQLISDDEMDSTKMAKKWENHRVRKNTV